MNRSMDAVLLRQGVYFCSRSPAEEDLPQLVHSNASTTDSSVSSPVPSASGRQRVVIPISPRFNHILERAAPERITFDSDLYTHDETCALSALSELSGSYAAIVPEEKCAQSLHDSENRPELTIGESRFARCPLTAVSSVPRFQFPHLSSPASGNVQDMSGGRKPTQQSQVMVTPYLRTAQSQYEINLPSIDTLYEATANDKDNFDGIKYECPGYRKTRGQQEPGPCDTGQQTSQRISPSKAAQGWQKRLETKPTFENVAAKATHLGGDFHSPRDSRSLLTSTFSAQALSRTYPPQEIQSKRSPVAFPMASMGSAHRRGPWVQEEDSALLLLVKTHEPNNWVRISQHMPYRSPKQCRERYYQELNPQFNHDPITPEEGVLIDKMVKEMGKRWGEIARRLGQRSDNAVKNWWNGSMNRRRKLHIQQEHHEGPPKPLSDTKFAVSTKKSPFPSQRTHELPREITTLPLVANTLTSSDDSSPRPIDKHEYQQRVGQAADFIEPSSSQDSSTHDFEETCDHCCSAFAHQTQEALTRLMTDVYALFNHRWPKETSIQMDCEGSGQSHCSSTTGASNGSLGPSQGSSGKSQGKRKRADRDSSPPNDGSGDDNKRPQLRGLQSNRAALLRKLACPYFKRDPKTYNTFGSCTGPGFRTTSRVKEHLYRCHLAPIRCRRCWLEVQNEQELENHSQNKIPCQAQQKPAIEGISPRKLELLKCKKRRTSDPGEEGKWRDIYGILFPGAPVPTSYYEYEPETKNEAIKSPASRSLQSFQDFSESRLPSLVEAKLETILQNKLHPLENELKSTVGDIVRNLLSELLSIWTQSIRDTTRPDEGGTIQNQNATLTGAPYSVHPEEWIEGDIAPFFVEPLPTAFPVDTVDNSENILQPTGSQVFTDSAYESLEPFSCNCNTSHNSFEGLNTHLQDARPGLNSLYNSYEATNINYSSGSNTNFEAPTGLSSSKNDSSYAASITMNGKGTNDQSVGPSFNLCDHCCGVL